MDWKLLVLNLIIFIMHIFHLTKDCEDIILHHIYLNAKRSRTIF
jgi:hypothetical protein